MYASVLHIHAYTHTYTRIHILKKFSEQKDDITFHHFTVSFDRERRREGQLIAASQSRLYSFRLLAVTHQARRRQSFNRFNQICLACIACCNHLHARRKFREELPRLHPNYLVQPVDQPHCVRNVCVCVCVRAWLVYVCVCVCMCVYVCVCVRACQSECRFVHT